MSVMDTSPATPSNISQVRLLFYETELLYLCLVNVTFLHVVCSFVCPPVSCLVLSPCSDSDYVTYRNKNKGLKQFKKQVILPKLQHKLTNQLLSPSIPEP